VSRRRILVGGGAAAAAAAAAACGAQDEVPAGSATGATVRVMTRPTPSNQHETAFSAFNATGGKTQVTIEQGPSDIKEYGAKMLSLAAADSAPDIMYTHPNFFTSLASVKVLADVEKLGAKTKFDFKGIQKELLDSDRWNGVLYALPYSGVAAVAVYNKDLFQKRGVQDPVEQAKQGKWTWEGFRTAMQKLTNRSEGQPPEVGMSQYLSGMQYTYQWCIQGGGQVWSKDLKQCTLNSKEAVAAFEFLQQLHSKDRVAIQPEERADFDGQVQDAFPTGRVGVRFRATTELYFYPDMAAGGTRIGVAPVPKGPDNAAPRGAANSWGIWSGSKAPGAAWDAVSAWHSDAVLKVLYADHSNFPCRLSQFDNPDFKASLYPWEDVEVEKDALRNVRLLPAPARFTEIDAIWTKGWPDVRDGKKTVKDWMAEFVPQANALLQV
jgi:multiple sugar transport system substrate-binding protein